MNISSINPTQTKSWKALEQHFNAIKEVEMSALFSKDLDRAQRFTIKWEDFYVDYSKNRITEETMQLLLNLADELKLKEAISSYFSGEPINHTEKRAVLHTALRANATDTVCVKGKNVIPEINEVKEKIKNFTHCIVSGNQKGFSGKAFTDIVNIGVGGSDLGPAMVVDSLRFYKNHLKTHFISNIDGDHISETLAQLNPETTLFIIVSKTFTTQETLANANTVKEWFLKAGTQKDIEKHFVAVSSNIKKVTTFGIHEDNIFAIWNWVGGRFSLWSAVGLTISLSLGFSNFESLLKGANKMDTHFKTEDFKTNIPVVLALLSVWYNNFFKSETEAVIAYSQYLNKLTSYLQQGIMESNGKSVDRNGLPVDYQTGTIVWGEPGTNSQHAFFQLIHQGTKLIPVDFIGFAESLFGNQSHHDKLISNYVAQTEALLHGKKREDVINDLISKKVTQDTIDRILPFKVFEGNKPTNSIFINKLTPESLGELLAMYEHKIFVQGIIWNIYSYDQYGVELGKQLANTILSEINEEKTSVHDASTRNLLAHYKSLK
ncbi:glucose-6-phosphate isomerase [Bizionia saleffrena]|uniref:Glucose-6-phosphate isomerase n=1 Tax=Bizionia saleffrena TaxID=291189 RepID=A0A8H2QES2_9FLAO|nr:glucose-6-phosphate isomerase [Bizionia saleffrena]TYB76017.1 glucose-6-phosphate isomerase [Bizionia saleffrena]